MAKMLRKSSSTTRTVRPLSMPSMSTGTRGGAASSGGRRTRSSAPASAPGQRQPGPQHREQLGRVDRLGHVAVGPGVQAALALPGRDLAGDRDHPEVRVEPACRGWPGWRRSRP